MTDINAGVYHDELRQFEAQGSAFTGDK